MLEKIAGMLDVKHGSFSLVNGTMNWNDKAVSKIFNSNVLNDIADGNFSYLQQVKNYISSEDPEVSLKQLYELTFDYLQKNYRNEYCFKNLIVNNLFLEKHSLNEATLLSEFRVGSNKADCVILNGKSVCYEIKTDYDSLIRLEDQLSSYIQLFDEVYVVCSSKHFEEVLRLVPEEIGVLLLKEDDTFIEVRAALGRNGALNKSLMINSLRQYEYKVLAERLVGREICLPNTLIYQECLSIFEQHTDDDQLNKYFIEILKKSRKNNATLIQNLPKSLANAAVSYRFKKKQITSLIKYFEEDPSNVLSDFEGAA